MDIMIDLARLAPMCSVSHARGEGGVNHLVVTLPKSSVPRMDLDSLHRKLMYEGHDCISKTDEATPSVLVMVER